MKHGAEAAIPQIAARSPRHVILFNIGQQVGLFENPTGDHPTPSPAAPGSTSDSRRIARAPGLRVISIDT